jgi:hypothetical protein
MIDSKKLKTILVAISRSLLSLFLINPFLDKGFILNLYASHDFPNVHNKMDDRRLWVPLSSLVAWL